MQQCVVVTGAARGIGLATAEALAARDVEVVGLDVLEADDSAPFAAYHRVDLTDSAGVTGVLEAIEKRSGRIRGLVNNAVVVRPAPFLEATLDDLDATYAVNIRGSFQIAQSVGRKMVRDGQGGSIVNLASVNGERGVVNTTVYSMSKAALAALTRCMAVELGPHGIRCNAVAPSPTATPRMLETMSTDALDERIDRIPLGRLGEPIDMGEVIAFLVSDEARFVNGVTLPVDGGYLAYGSGLPLRQRNSAREIGGDDAR